MKTNEVERYNADIISTSDTTVNHRNVVRVPLRFIRLNVLDSPIFININLNKDYHNIFDIVNILSMNIYIYIYIYFDCLNNKTTILWLSFMHRF